MTPTIYLFIKMQTSFNGHKNSKINESGKALTRASKIISLAIISLLGFNTLINSAYAGEWKWVNTPDGWQECEEINNELWCHE